MKEADRPEPSRTYFFFNLGCPKNLVDAEKTAYGLEKRGWSRAESPETAALLVITTCAFISSAVEESVEEILRVASARRASQKLAVLGCLVSREGEKLESLFPEVDLFLAVPEMESLAHRADRLFTHAPLPAPCPGPEATGGHGRILFTPGHTAYLKIAEGCSNRCSYCLIPAIRGVLSSRSRDEILSEAEMLAGAGVREIVVIAQDTGAWGSEPGNVGDLYGMLGDLGSISGIEWIRLMYLHPAHIDPQRILKLIDGGKVIPYLDLPVQHANDRILERMGRRYRKADLSRILADLRSGNPGLVLRTTVMAGFPGETDDEFAELLDFMAEQRFDHLGVFAWSAEKGTAAARLRGRVDPSTVRARMGEITDLQMEISQEKMLARVGETLTVLVDGGLPRGEKPSDGVWGTGRFYGQAPEIDGLTYLSGSTAAAGNFAKARVTDAEAFDLFAALE
ncbi:MAG: 30S ribosomal protein S12 methylthiotransferase RimO [Candidatus Krumholzibacteria bacterium]|jgi:ribosomal protein S12 methylthiotransferase|nr:30S ribosomal protein S12 methylthiotransferase RimO [Candidatus Krumholzibacteria bacterium]